MAELSLPNPPAEPCFLTYLLAPNKKHDCFFMVGKRELVEPKKIGAVKIMLMAHSEVLRVELEDSEIAEKGVVPVEDLYPDTFINLLKYVYGHDNTASLSFNEADDLLYAAEKYIMAPLKASLSARLMTLLTPNNICQLLNNPTCYGTLELKFTITRILQDETDRVLASPAFVNLNLDGFIKILEQETMNVNEIEVWRAAVKWGTNRGGTEEGRVLSEQLSEPLKHIRVCTISLESFARVVVPTNILNDLSVKLVFMYHGTKEKQAELVQVSNETEPRKMKQTNETKSIGKNVFANISFSSDINRKGSLLTFLTKKFGLELLPLQFSANMCSSHSSPDGLTYQCGTVKITEITDYVNNTSTKPPVTVRFSQQVEYGASFQVPLTSNGENIRLLPNTKYTLAVHFTEPHTMYTQTRETFICNEHMIICFEHVEHGGYYCSPVDTLWYRPVGVSIAEHQ